MRTLDEMIDIHAAAKILGLSERAVYDLIAAKKLGHYRPGLRKGKIMTTERYCLQYLETVKVEPVSDSQPTTNRKPTRRTSGDVKERLARFGIKI